MPRRLPIFVVVTALAGSAVLASGSPTAGAGTVSVQVVSRDAKVKVESNETIFFNDGSDFSLKCPSVQQDSIGFGIREASRHVVGASFGPQVLAGFAAGAKGSTTLRMQVLCAKRARVNKKYAQGKATGDVTESGRPGFKAKATVNCGSGAYALGAAMSSQFAPVTGPFSSGPDKSGRHWTVEARGIPGSFPVDQTDPVRADVACVSKKSLRSYTTKSESTTKLGSASSATLDVSCTGGRRAIGWGVELAPVGSGSDDFGIPLVEQAQFRGTKMRFTLALPPGAESGSGSGAEQSVTVVCGTWR